MNSQRTQTRFVFQESRGPVGGCKSECGVREEVRTVSHISPEPAIRRAKVRVDLDPGVGLSRQEPCRRASVVS